MNDDARIIFVSLFLAVLCARAARLSQVSGMYVMYARRALTAHPVREMHARSLTRWKICIYKLLCTWVGFYVFISNSLKSYEKKNTQKQKNVYTFIHGYRTQYALQCILCARVR